MEEIDKRKLSGCWNVVLHSIWEVSQRLSGPAAGPSFSDEVSDVKQSKKMRGLTHLNNLPVTVDENLDYGITKGVVYI